MLLVDGLKYRDGKFHLATPFCEIFVRYLKSGHKFDGWLGRMLLLHRILTISKVRKRHFTAIQLTAAAARLTTAGYAHINMTTEVDDVRFKWVTDLHHVCPNFPHSSLYNDKFK